MLKKNNILITGAAGGFGKLIAKELITAGYNVAAAMRDINGRNLDSSEELRKLGAFVVEIDITQDISVNAGIAFLNAQMGTIDVLINNAGLGALGIQEGFTPDDWRKIFEVNVFGVQRMIRAVLPGMKEQRRGMLLLISSLTGRLSIPFQGPYGPSKWAAEALSESYRIEVAQFGIESCIVEPGGFPTSFIDGLMQPADAARLNNYGVVKDMPAGFLSSFEEVFAANPQQNPQQVADGVRNLIELEHGSRPVRTIIDYMGLGKKVEPYNHLLEKINSEVYTDFGINHFTEISK